MTEAEKSVAKVFDLLLNYGHNNYVGEEVTCLQHSVQAATSAEAEGASEEVVIGAMLHDIGHLLGLAQDLPKMITDGRELGAKNHETLGGDFLKELSFPKIVCDIARGHVNAKRYLVVIETGYYDRSTEMHSVSSLPFNMSVAQGKPACAYAQSDVDLQQLHNFQEIPGLSETSKETLVHQGGPMSAEEINSFEHSVAFDAILKMRRWDEKAKDPSIPVDHELIARYKSMCLRILKFVKT